MKFATVYAITRHPGGPEEGGWWYNWWEPVETVPYAADLTNADIDAIANGLLRKHAGAKHGDIYSVLGGVDIDVATDEDTPAENRTTERPHYE